MRSRDLAEHREVVLFLARELALLVGLLEGGPAGDEEMDLGKAEREARRPSPRGSSRAGAAARPRTRACAGGSAAPGCRWRSPPREARGSPAPRPPAGPSGAAGCSSRAPPRRARDASACGRRRAAGARRWASRGPRRGETWLPDSASAGGSTKMRTLRAHMRSKASRRSICGAVISERYAACVSTTWT